MTDTRRPYAAQRQQVLLQTLRGHGRLDVTAMSDQLDVSTETIRKDLTELERKGLLRKVHGGAIAIEGLSFEPSLAVRTGNTKEKQRIARAALEHIPAKGAVMLDAGTTTKFLADMFPADRDLAVFTNSLPIALSLVSRPRLSVHAFGGRVRSHDLAGVDNWAIRALNEIRVDVAFLGTNGMTLEHGLSTPDESVATVKRLMFQVARRKILLTDHSKLGQICLFKYSDLTDVDLLVTDKGLPDDDAKAIEDAGVEVIRA